MSAKKTKNKIHNDYSNINAAETYFSEEAIRRDIAERFKDYDNDPSIGNMYQRKKKSATTKTKRSKKTKDCGCK